jgi:hypothetical protein
MVERSSRVNAGAAALDDPKSCSTSYLLSRVTVDTYRRDKPKKPKRLDSRRSETLALDRELVEE